MPNPVSPPPRRRPSTETEAYFAAFGDGLRWSLNVARRYGCYGVADAIGQRLRELALERVAAADNYDERTSDGTLRHHAAPAGDGDAPNE